MADFACQQKLFKMGRKNSKFAKKKPLGPKNKPLKKQKPARDFRHTLQRKIWKESPQVKRRELPLENVQDEPAHVDAVDQLLATFSTARKIDRLKAVESDSEEDSDESAVDEDGGDSQMQILESDENKDSEDDKDGVEEDEEIPDIVAGDSKSDVACDPYQQHLSGNLSPSLLASLESTKKNCKTHPLDWPILGQVKVSIPVQESAIETLTTTLDEQEFVSPGKSPKRITNVYWKELSVKQQIANNIRTVNDGKQSELTPLQCELFSVINNYQDLLMPLRTYENGEEVRFVYCLHVINHVLKAQTRVLQHNDSLGKRDKSDVDLPDEFRDQGLVRPKVLILVPFRDSAHRIINMMAKLIFGDKKQNVVNRTRFEEDYTGSELFLPKKNPKPEDFEKLFCGNIDDNFRIGVCFAKKSMKLYADFYSSDVIIASPLGVRMLIGAEGDRERDYDFISSLEMLIMDQMDVFQMQNWDHVVHLMNHIHLQPKDSHGTDFSRVRLWALNGWARYYRQTICISSILTPEINALYARHCNNYAGAVRVTPKTEGTISQVLVTLPHVYRRFKCTSLAESHNERFKFFTEEILPQFLEMSGVLFYIPSYFDFVRLRNWFKTKDYSFVQISEYSKDGKVARARDMFYHNEARFLLYSERFHFYRRVNVKGIRHLVFYQPPTFPHFYSELSNMMQEANQNGAAGDDGSQTVTVVLSQYDVHSLAGIVRAPRAARILNSDKNVFMFTTGKE